MGQIRVTVIDDDADVLDLFREILEEDGFAVETVSEAMPGIERIVASRPDLLIVDLLLDPHREELTGLQLVHAARSSSELRSVPIIVCSADPPGLEAAWPELMDRGDIHQLSKPFNLATFERVLATALGRPQPGNRGGEAGTLSAIEPDDELEGTP